MSDLKNKAISGIIWRFLERCGAQGVSFIVSIVLARLLDPDAYGTISLVLVFTSILQVFVDSGLGNALIQKKNADQLDFSSVFYFSIVMCIALYILIFLLAPYIEDFYEMDNLTSVIRVLSLTLLLSPLKNVQQSYVFKKMMHRKFFFSTIGSTFFSAALGIYMAYRGFGVWALVCQQLVNLILSTIILWLTVKWRPIFCFSFERLKGLFSYGWKLLLSSVFHTVYTNLRSLLIGKFYTSEDLAFYNKGQSFPSIIVNNINTSIDNVLFPVMSIAQDELDKIKNMTRRAISAASYIMWPLMIGLAVVSSPLIQLLLTEKWLPAVPYLQIICLTLAFEPIQTANLNAIKALGRSDIYLKLEILKKSISILILLISVKFGVIAITVSGLCYTIIATVINALPNARLLKYSYLNQLRDMLPSFLLSVLMGAAIYPISFLKIPTMLVLVIQVLSGIIIYVGISHLFKLKPYIFIRTTLFDLLKSRKNK